MPDLAAELWAVQELAALCGMNVTNIRDAKTALGPVEWGLDVVFDLDGRTVGAQHTIFHWDEGQTPGKRGSLARAKEETTARASQTPFGVWVDPDYRPALGLRVQEKCAIAGSHDTRHVVAETWLVISAGLNRWGAAASTMIVPGHVQADELNRLFHSPLCASRFERAYLVLHIGSVVFDWTRAEGWRIVADPDASERELHRARMTDLIFNQISNHHRRSPKGG